MSYDQEKRNLTEVGTYLEKMDIPHDLVDIEDSEGKRNPAIVTNYKCRDYQFEVTIRNNEDWINVYCFVLDTSELDDDALLSIYKACLELNFRLPEVTFSAWEDSIYIEADMLVGVPFKDFAAEFNSIALGIDHFVDLLKPREVTISDTWGRRR